MTLINGVILLVNDSVGVILLEKLKEVDCVGVKPEVTETVGVGVTELDKLVVAEGVIETEGVSEVEDD